MDRKDRKYGELASDVFCHGHPGQSGFDREAANQRVHFGTNADWKTEAARAKPQNATNPNAAYKARQNELSSN